MKSPVTLMCVGLLTVCTLLPNTIQARQASSEVIVSSLKGLYDMTNGQITATAELLDETMYAYRPIEGVRTAGEIIGHIAAAQFMFCSAAAGEENPHAADAEQMSGSRDELRTALAEGIAYCNQVFAQTTDAEVTAMRSFFGNPMSVAGILAFNTTHNYEHYGNLTTYMRMNGIVPPSSR